MVCNPQYTCCFCKDVICYSRKKDPMISLFKTFLLFIVQLKTNSTLEAQCP